MFGFPLIGGTSQRTIIFHCHLYFSTTYDHGIKKQKKTKNSMALPKFGSINRLRSIKTIHSPKKLMVSGYFFSNSFHITFILSLPSLFPSCILPSLWEHAPSHSLIYHEHLPIVQDSLG